MERTELGVVIEWRASDHPWQDGVWTPVAVLPGADPIEAWRELRRDDGLVQHHAATLTLELFKGETEGYMVNLAQPSPSVFVVLQTDVEGDREVEVARITACPFEAMGYQESGDDIVEAVAMPEPVRAWVQAFCDRHHDDTPFKKRKNRPHDADADTGPRPHVRSHRRSGG